MLNYITVGTNDLARAGAFYDAVLGALGYARLATSEREIGYGVAGQGHCRFWVNLPFDTRPATVGNGSMPAFDAPTRDAVVAAHKAGLEQGGSDEGAPGLRPSYGPNFFTCYLRDPDGNKLSAVCEAP